MLRGGYYFGIEPGNSMQATGFWNPNKEDLKQIRDHIATEPKRLAKVLNGKRLKDTWGSLEGNQLKKAPRGFDPENAAVDFLKYNQHLLYKKYSDKEILAPGFEKVISNNFKKVRPFLNYMSEILTHDLNGEMITELR